MAVSFLSKTLAPTPYIAPVDANLLYGAMLQKQQRYEAGLQKADQLYQSLTTADIINEGHKAYYDEKKQKLTEQFNSLGSADFSDRSVLQQLGSLSGTISGDTRIVGAIADTQKIRKDLAQNELWKADPKKYPGQWAAQNEAYLTQTVNSYRTQTDPDARYTGSAIPFFDHKKVLDDKLAKIQKAIAQYGSYTTTDGQYLTKTAELTPARIGQIVQAELGSDPRFKQQLGIDAWYTFRGASDDSLRATRGLNLTLEMGQLQAEKKSLETDGATLLAKLSGDKTARKRASEELAARLAPYDARLAQYQQELGSLDQLPRSALEQGLHLDNYVNGFKSEYMFRSVDKKFDPMYAAKLKHSEWANDYNKDISQFGQTLKFKYDELAQKAQLAREAQEAKELSENGLKKNADGSISAIGLTDLSVVSAAAETPTTTLTGLKDTYDQTTSAMNADLRKLLVEYVAAGDMELAGQLKEKLGNSRSVLDKNGYTTGEKMPGSYSPKTAKTIVHLMNQYQNLVNGRPVDPKFEGSLTANGQRIFNRIRQQQVLAQLQRQQYKTVSEDLRRQAGFSDAELAELTTLQQQRKANPRAFSVDAVPETGDMGIMATYSPGAKRLAELEDRWTKATENATVNLPGVLPSRYLVTGKSADENGKLMGLIRSGIRNRMQDQTGETAATFRANADKLDRAQFSDIEIDKTKGTVTFGATIPKSGSDPAQPLGRFTLNLAGTPEFAQLLPRQVQNPVAPHIQLLQDELDRKGVIAPNGRAMTFGLDDARHPPLQFTIRKAEDGGYQLGYLYNGTQVPLPLMTRKGDYLLPQDALNRGAVNWMSGSLNNWFTTYFAKPLIDRFGKGNPNYTPTVADFHQLMQDKTLFIK